VHNRYHKRRTKLIENGYLGDVIFYDDISERTVIVGKVVVDETNDILVHSIDVHRFELPLRTESLLNAEQCLLDIRLSIIRWCPCFIQDRNDRSPLESCR